LTGSGATLETSLADGGNAVVYGKQEDNFGDNNKIMILILGISSVNPNKMMF
jgi:hypothetical protein